MHFFFQKNFLKGYTSFFGNLIQKDKCVFIIERHGFMKKTSQDVAWEHLFDYYNIYNHDFDERPYHISAQKIKSAMKQISTRVTSEPRILCKHDRREDRAQILKELGLFILPVKNGHYLIIRGEGYIDIPEMSKECIIWPIRKDIIFDSMKIGSSEMQHIDFAFAQGIIEDFFELENLHLSIRGRKFGTEKFEFYVGKHRLIQKGTQIEVDAGYENADTIVLLEAKSGGNNNIIARQCYYPYRYWSSISDKNIVLGFFEFTEIIKNSEYIYDLWKLEIKKPEEYNSFNVTKHKKYKVNTRI